MHFIDSGANVAIHYFSIADTANELVKNELVKYETDEGLKAIAISGDLTEEEAMVKKPAEANEKNT